MRRRDFITLLGGGAAAAPWILRPLTARAQPMKRVGVLFNGAAAEAAIQSNLTAFVDALRQLGWSDGETIRIDVRWSAGDAALAKIYAAQLIGLQPNVILAASTQNLMAIRDATSTVPV